MIDERGYVEDLLAFLNAGRTPFHAVAEAVGRLERRGFRELREGDAWRLERGAGYYVKRNSSAFIAFEVGEGDLPANGFRVIAAHADSPGFKIKPGGCIATGDGYLKLNTEGYGGAILSTWFDRPLGVAGRLISRASGGGVRELLVDTGEPVAIIPSLCIHFNREVNNGYAYNKQTDLLPLLGFASGGAGDTDALVRHIAAGCGCGRDDILDYELFLYDSAPGAAMGREGEFLSAPRIDDLSMLHAGLTGLSASGPAAFGKVLAAFDNEEVGSVTAGGGDSTFLSGCLRRVCLAFGCGEEDWRRAVANSLAVSADAAHAVHPNYPDRHDPVNRPVLGGGPAIKYSANQRYVTNAVTAAAFLRVCERAGVPCQSYVNRSDILGGSTIGPCMSAMASLATVDVGTPILSMHSVRELAAAADCVYTARAFAEFYAAEPQ